MSIWKEIRVSDIMRNRAGAVNHNKSYKALEIESYEEFVKVLAQLEPGFEEYFVFEKEHYNTIPDLELGQY